jgi:predicted type IV restriction endonuclease
MPAPREILDLVARFEPQLDAYKSGHYNETQLRREFLDPLFKAIGWDMDNTAGYAEAYKDVIHEDAIRIGDQSKAPDYCFRIGGTRKFFLEAKKPAVFIKEETPPAYQLRSYAWSAKLPLSILSDFEEFAVYDCRIKPQRDDPAHDRMVALVEQMLALHQQLAAARTPQEQTALERQIAATDAQIDRLVYDLYGLTEDEIKIVEGKADGTTAIEIPKSNGGRLTPSPRDEGVGRGPGRGVTLASAESPLPDQAAQNDYSEPSA